MSYLKLHGLKFEPSNDMGMRVFFGGDTQNMWRYPHIEQGYIQETSRDTLLAKMQSTNTMDVRKMDLFDDCLDVLDTFGMV